jgi:5-methylcytosine-specific restriction endonuclease McrA
MGKKTPPFPPYPKWTKAKFWGFIRSNLRRTFMKYPVPYEVLNNNRRPYSGKDKRTKWEYKCAECGEWFKRKEVEVDHIYEVGKLKDYDDLPSFTRRLFCSASEMQVLCKKCHNKKTHKPKVSNSTPLK